MEHSKITFWLWAWICELFTTFGIVAKFFQTYRSHITKLLCHTDLEYRETKFQWNLSENLPLEQNSKDEVLHFEAGLNDVQIYYPALFMLLESRSHAVTSVIRSVPCSFLNTFIWKDQQLRICVTQSYNYCSFTEYNFTEYKDYSSDWTIMFSTHTKQYKR